MQIVNESRKHRNTQANNTLTAIRPISCTAKDTGGDAMAKQD